MSDRPLDCSGPVADVLTDWRIVKSMADEAHVVATWAMAEELDTAWWRLVRRRYLADVRDQMLEVHRSLYADIEKAEARGVDARPLDETEPPMRHHRTDGPSA